MARLLSWAENSIKTIDERGDGTARIRLVSADGSTWQTWDAPFPKPEDWVADAEALCAELAEDFQGEVHCMFIAESVSGTVRSQCPRKIAGKQRKGPGGFGQQGAPLQAMYEAQARTVERTLQSANVQLEVLTRTVESQAKANSELLDFIRMRNEHEAMDRAESTSDVQQMLGQLLEQAPLLIELAMAKTKGTKGAKAAGGGLAEKVQNAVTETVKTAAVEAASNGAQQLAGAMLPTAKGN